MRGKFYSILFILVLCMFALSFVSANLTDGLVSYYKLDETSGTTVIDAHGTNNGINNGATQGNASGILGTSYNFDGTNDHIDIPDLVEGNSEITINIWAKSDVGASSRIAISQDGVFRVGEISTSGIVEGFIDTGGVRNTVTGSATVTNLNMYTITYNGTDVKLYINGSEADSDPASGTIDIDPSWSTDIGRWSSGGLYWDGVIDEVGIWSMSLNANDISELYNDGKGFAYPFLLPENATFENVNVTNNLEVGQNITGLKGFFDFLGSSVSRIMKGWFTNIDVSETANLTGDTYLTNSSCSAEQVLTTDSNGLVSCTDVIEIKSGSASVTEDSCTSITFNTNFSNTPVAVGNVQSGAEDNVVSIGSLSTSGFDLCLEKVGGGAASTYTVYWTATNIGNP